MAESLEPPAPMSQDELAKIKDGAARALVERADEEDRIAFIKAVEARKRREEVATQVGIKSREGRGSEPGTQENPENLEKGKTKVEDKRANAGNSEPARLQPLPVGGQPVKAVAKEMCAQVVQLLQTADLTKDAPERLILLWMDMSKKVRAAGLGEAEVKAAVAQVTGAERCVKLCINASNDDLIAWAARLSEKYLNTSKAATLSSRLYKAAREPTETALAFLTRGAAGACHRIHGHLARGGCLRSFVANRGAGPELLPGQLDIL
jgi:hypothetical protein